MFMKGIVGVLFILTLFYVTEGWLYLVVPLEEYFKWVITFYHTYGVDPLNSFPLMKWDLELFKNHRIPFYIHISMGPLALICGFFQFLPGVRKSYPSCHKWTGYVYYISQLLGITGGMYLGMFEYGGIAAFYGFLGMGMTTLISSFMALYFILQRNLKQHQQWMVRSYFTMWSSVVIFRLAIIYWIPFEIQRTGGVLPADFKDPYLCCIFLSWSIALLFSDVYISLFLA